MAPESDTRAAATAPVPTAAFPALRPENSTPRKLVFCVNGGRHCLHKAGIEQHQITVEGGVHVDQLCCWCAASSCRDMIAIVRRGHGPYVPPGMKSGRRYANATKIVLEIYNRAHRTVERNMFSGDDLDVMRLLLSGRQHKEIYAALGITSYSYQARLESLRKKVGARTNIQLFMMVAKSNIL